MCVYIHGKRDIGVGERWRYHRDRMDWGGGGVRNRERERIFQ